MRSFVTFEFTKETREKIAEIQSVIRKNSECGRFKHISNFHLTLKFLGEVENSKINSIGESIEKEIKDESIFCINLNGIDAFGMGEIVKTIYIKIEGEMEKLSKLVKKIDDVCKIYGFKGERFYTPHITIAQEVKLTVPFGSLKKELNYEFCKNILFDRVTIMKSEQIGNKRVYTPIKYIYLK
jgi:2'-5' RNA ligase